MATPTTSSRSGVRGTKGKAVTDTTRIGLQLTPCVKLPEEMIETVSSVNEWSTMKLFGIYFRGTDLDETLG